MYPVLLVRARLYAARLDRVGLMKRRVRFIYIGCKVLMEMGIGRTGGDTAAVTSSMKDTSCLLRTVPTKS